tara:strand:- start:326 stop:487 length:162 start_codon:yes stop_codon:yes gene_type:complete
VWEPATAMAFSIFITVSLFLTVYGLAYLGVILLIKAVRSIKKQLMNNGDHNDE